MTAEEYNTLKKEAIILSILCDEKYPNPDMTKWDSEEEMEIKKRITEISNQVLKSKII